MNNSNIYEYQGSKSVESSVIKNIFIWMAAGLALTGFVSHGLYTSGLVLQVVKSGLMLPLIIGEFALVFILSRNIMNFKATTAISLFLIYSALNGITLSSIFLVYTYTSISNTFFITAGLFAVMAFYGMTTKRDLTKLSTYFFMGILGIIIASLVNLFLRSSGLYYLISFAGVILFTGLTAYDIQKFTRISNEIGNSNGELEMKVSIIGALNLYLDFINLFLFLLRFLGRRK